jgi:hypothetical protein
LRKKILEAKIEKEKDNNNVKKIKELQKILNNIK